MILPAAVGNFFGGYNLVSVLGRCGIKASAAIRQFCFSLIWLRCIASARGNVIGVRAFTGVGPQPPDLHTDVASV